MKTYAEPPAGQPLRYEHTRPIFTPDGLASLDGPTKGILTLPIHLDWSAGNSYDLSKPQRLEILYSTVIREAKSEQDLANYLNEAILRQVWRCLRIPQYVRAAWESTFPELAAC